MKILMLVVALFLSACSSTQGLSGLSFFSVSNAEAELALKQQLPKLSEKISVLGLPVQFDVNDLSVKIGPENRNVIALGANASAKIDALVFTYPVRLKLQIEGTPFYDSNSKAVFIRNIKLLDSSIDAGGYSGNLGVLNQQAMNLINAFLDVNPVYTLDMNNPKMALLSKLPLDIQIVEGAIRLTPQI